jgi:hypothetical protein
VVACVGHFTNRRREADKRKVETYVNAVGQGSMPLDASFRAISRYISSNMGLATALGLSSPSIRAKPSGGPAAGSSAVYLNQGEGTEGQDNRYWYKDSRL